MVLRHTSPQTGIIGFYAGHPTTREAVPRRPGILIQLPLKAVKDPLRRVEKLPTAAGTGENG